MWYILKWDMIFDFQLALLQAHLKNINTRPSSLWVCFACFMYITVAVQGFLRASHWMCQQSAVQIDQTYKFRDWEQSFGQPAVAEPPLRLQSCFENLYCRWSSKLRRWEHIWFWWVCSLSAASASVKVIHTLSCNYYRTYCMWLPKCPFQHVYCVW